MLKKNNQVIEIMAIHKQLQGHRSLDLRQWLKSCWSLGLPPTAS